MTFSNALAVLIALTPQILAIERGVTVTEAPLRTTLCSENVSLVSAPARAPGTVPMDSVSVEWLDTVSAFKTSLVSPRRGVLPG